MNTLSILAIIAAFAMIVSPLAATSVFAHDDEEEESSSVSALIEQAAECEQDSFVVSGDDTKDSGNNDCEIFQFNEGNAVAAQENN
jgi:hypothetical protein